MILTITRLKLFTLTVTMIELGFSADWPAPSGVRTLQTTRLGGVSVGPWASLNLAAHVGDEPHAVACNRQRLRHGANLPFEPLWLNQVHGTRVWDVQLAQPPLDADAVISRSEGNICVVMTADCLPVLLCDRAGGVVAAVHAGWRGLVNGVIEATVAATGISGDQLLAWLGPAIGARHFEVGDIVRDAFVHVDAAAAAAFVGKKAGKYWADIYLLARQRLEQSGVKSVYGGNHCTVSDSERFFSYRRDGVTGRMATLIWIERV